MTNEQVAELIEKIPQGLGVDEFLVALANMAADWQREQSKKNILEETKDHDYEYREFAIELAEVL